MPSYATAPVVEVLSERQGLQRVQLGDGSRAYVLTQLTGTVAVGDEVVVNTTAVQLGLGTGGWHIVHWNLSRREWIEPGPGHIMKLRYTSLQADTGAGSEDHPEVPDRLDGTPVVVCSLHSQIPGVVAAAKVGGPELTVVYVMTDGGGLPIAFSDLASGMRGSGLLDGTVTAGHAFGGDLEAVNVPSALTLARHILRADVIVVAMGPGIVGTGTRLGTTALEAAPALDAAAWLGGQPIACVRSSEGDARERHRGVSHHTSTVLEAVRSPVEVALPHGWPDMLVDFGSRHRVTTLDAPDVRAILTGHGVHVTTMGRGPDEEPGFLAACSAAGALAARLAVAHPVDARVPGPVEPTS